jgi:hypothetical protein
VTKLGKSEGTAVAPAPSSVEPTAKSAPLDPGAGLGEHEVKAIARVLRQAGYAPVHRKGRPVGDEHPRRFEAPHRNALWQLDFTELRVGAERRWLLVIEDDFSRFVVGHVLAEGPTSEVMGGRRHRDAGVRHGRGPAVPTRSAALVERRRRSARLHGGQPITQWMPSSAVSTSVEGAVLGSTAGNPGELPRPSVRKLPHISNNFIGLGDWQLRRDRRAELGLGLLVGGSSRRLKGRPLFVITRRPRAP